MTPGSPGQASEADEAAAPYRVLARKYRPATFDDLIGQDAMVRTLTNAFAAGRIAQAYMLTGVRGVGKTTTARIIARALNYTPAGASEEDGGPTIAMPEPGIHCAAIMESHHPDVIEMDAASHTGIDDIREIIESARYRPVSARYKVYIIDEVHMLSRQAFNGLLKTLEEPPEHARFIFATTEIRKVPVTVLSRCQRFDLRRVDADKLVTHFTTIAEQEGAVLEPDAAALIARAAEGSVRDGLSLLDQAIALGQGTVAETDVRQMLGLADRARVIDLFEMLMKGETGSALDELRAQYDAGADPVVILTDLAEFVHLVTRTKVSPASLDDPALSEAERTRAKDAAGTLGMGSLARAWQMLLKGLDEVDNAARPVQAAEMVMIRLAYASDLPTPADLVKALQDGPAGDGGTAPASTPPEPHPATAPVSLSEPVESTPPPVIAAESPASEQNALPMPDSFAEAAEIVGDLDIRLVDAIERTVRPVAFEPGRIEVALTDDARPDLANRFAEILKRATGTPWVVAIVSEGGGETLREASETAAAKERAEIEAHPVVRSVKELFPGSEVVDVRSLPGSDGTDEPGAEFDGADAPDDISRQA